MSLAIFQNYLRNLVPTNILEEKERFFTDQNYNPQFKYSIPISFDQPPYQGLLETTHLAVATRTLEDTLAQFGTEEAYLFKTEGDVLPEESVLSQINSYLTESGVHNIVNLVLSTDYSSRTALEKVESGYELRIRKPIEYRAFSLRGMLHHEIGTHLYRWRNDELVWQQIERSPDLHDFRETEEGLASFHTLLENKAPYLWTPALYYYTVATAKEKSFSSLFSDLEKFVADPGRRWELSVRAKRGLTDTSQPGGFFKDQTYLSGAIAVAEWITLNPTLVKFLYLGKIAIADINTLKANVAEPAYLPPFLSDEKKYLNRMREIFSFNHLH